MLVSLSSTDRLLLVDCIAGDMISEDILLPARERVEGAMVLPMNDSCLLGNSAAEVVTVMKNCTIFMPSVTVRDDR